MNNVICEHPFILGGRPPTSYVDCENDGLSPSVRHNFNSGSNLIQRGGFNSDFKGGHELALLQRV